MTGGTNDCNDTFVARLLADGSFDPTFGNAGVAVIDAATGFTAACGDFGKALALQPDGRILVTSEAQNYDAPPSPLTYSDRYLFRLDPDGAFDPSFGTEGFVSRFDAAPNAMALQSDGKVVTAGFGEEGVYNPPYFIYLDT